MAASSQQSPAGTGRASVLGRKTGKTRQSAAPARPTQRSLADVGARGAVDDELRARTQLLQGEREAKRPNPVTEIPQNHPNLDILWLFLGTGSTEGTKTRLVSPARG